MINNMVNLSGLTARRSEIVEQMSGIKSMRKGVLNAKFQTIKYKNGAEAVKGPYYVLTKKAPGGKTISQSVSAADAPHVQEEVDNYKMFRELADEYVEVCEQISIMTDISEESKKNKPGR